MTFNDKVDFIQNKIFLNSFGQSLISQRNNLKN